MGEFLTEQLKPLIDEKNGNKWLIKVDNGKLIIEPVEIEDKRDHKIKSILDDNI